MMLNIGQSSKMEVKWTPFGTKFDTFYKKSSLQNSVTKWSDLLVLDSINPYWVLSFSTMKLKP